MDQVAVGVDLVLVKPYLYPAEFLQYLVGISLFQGADDLASAVFQVFDRLVVRRTANWRNVA